MIADTFQLLVIKYVAYHLEYLWQFVISWSFFARNNAQSQDKSLEAYQQDVFQYSSLTFISKINLQI